MPAWPAVWRGPVRHPSRRPLHRDRRPLPRAPLRSASGVKPTPTSRRVLPYATRARERGERETAGYEPFDRGRGKGRACSSQRAWFWAGRLDGCHARSHVDISFFAAHDLHVHLILPGTHAKDVELEPVAAAIMFSNRNVHQDRPAIANECV